MGDQHRSHGGTPRSTRSDRPLVIIPAWNEEAPLPSVLESLATSAPNCDVVVISDGSTDRTAEVARAGGATVIELPFNLGIGGALRAGFRYAVREGYQRAVQFDADGQHDPTQIPVLLEALDNGAELVIGSRFASQAGYRVGKVRGGAMGLLRFTVNRLTGQTFTDTSSGFRGFNRAVLEFFAETYPSEYMESVEALLMAHRHGFNVVEVPVQMRERQDGTASNRNLKLLYHYTRLLLTIAVSASGHNRKRQQSQKEKRPAIGEIGTTSTAREATA
ncbi:MAG: glycosyltransferase family 2 protein [Acidimicrobiales bacterium]|nr:glycosyltransferase family 2 protein [Acidimicrobiales bacterium]